MLKERILPPASTGKSFPALTQSIFIEPRGLPAHPFVRDARGWPAGLLQIYQIHYNVTGLQVGIQGLSVDSTRSNDDYFCLAQYMFQTGAEQGTDVRNDFLDVLAIRSNQLSQRDVIIPNLNLAAFFFLVPRMIERARSRCASLLGKMDSNKGNSRSSSFAR